jgi:chromosome partitioning protein
MKCILVANPKGGCGKTTIATNLAGYLARKGERVILSDMDRQGSSRRWLERRPEALPTIHQWDGRQDDAFKFDFRPDWVVLDAPAGIRGESLRTAIRNVERILVPVLPSLPDMEASKDFLIALADIKRVRKDRCQVVLVANRVNQRVLAAKELDDFLAEFELPVLTHLRDTQNYVQVVATGQSIFDLPFYRSRRDRSEWEPIIKWLKS